MYSTVRGKKTNGSTHFSQSHTFLHGPFSKRFKTHHNPSIFLNKFEFSPFKGLLTHQPSVLKKMILHQLDRNNLSLNLTEDVYVNYLKKYTNKTYDRSSARNAFVDMIDEWTHLMLYEFITNEKITYPISISNQTTPHISNPGQLKNQHLLTTLFNSKNLDKHVNIKQLKKNMKTKQLNSDKTNIHDEWIFNLFKHHTHSTQHSNSNICEKSTETSIEEKVANVNHVENKIETQTPIETVEHDTENQVQTMDEMNQNENTSELNESVPEPMLIFVSSENETPEPQNTDKIHEDVTPYILSSNQLLENEHWTNLESETTLDSDPKSEPVIIDNASVSQTSSVPNSTCLLM